MYFSKNIKLELKAMGSQRDIAKSLNITEVYLGKMLNGHKPINDTWKKKFSEYVKVPVYELEKENYVSSINIARGGRSGSPVGAAVTYRTNDGKDLFTGDGRRLVTIPMLDISASAGNGVVNFSDDIIMQVVFDIFIKTTGLKIKESDVVGQRYCFLQIRGDSMSPELEDGNIALIDTSATEIQQYRQIMVFSDGDGEVYIKEVHKEFGGIVHIISYNKAYRSYKNLTEEAYDKQFGGKITMIGTVIWKGGGVSYLKNNGGVEV